MTERDIQNAFNIVCKYMQLELEDAGCAKSAAASVEMRMSIDDVDYELIFKKVED